MDRFHGIRMKLAFEEMKRPYLLDITSLLYDFELAHDLSLLLSVAEYSDYRFSQYFWYRNGRPLKPDHKLRAAKIVKQSPLTVELIIDEIAATSGALWILIQTIEKVANWRLNRRKLQLEIEKLEQEIREGRREEKMPDLEQKTDERGAAWILGSLIGRLERNPIHLVDVEVTTEKKTEHKDSLHRIE